MPGLYHPNLRFTDIIIIIYNSIIQLPLLVTFSLCVFTPKRKSCLLFFLLFHFFKMVLPVCHIRRKTSERGRHGEWLLNRDTVFGRPQPTPTQLLSLLVAPPPTPRQQDAPARSGRSGASGMFGASWGTGNAGDNNNNNNDYDEANSRKRVDTRGPPDLNAPLPPTAPGSGGWSSSSRNSNSGSGGGGGAGRERAKTQGPPDGRGAGRGGVFSSAGAERRRPAAGGDDGGGRWGASRGGQGAGAVGGR